MTDAQRALLTDRQLELAFLGLYEQHKDHIGTVATLVQIQVHIFALADRLAAAEETSRIADAALSEAEAWIKILEKERKV